MQISPANTSDELTTHSDSNLYSRTALPDFRQARALADIILGHQIVSIIAIDDPLARVWET